MHRSQLDIWIEELGRAWEQVDPARAAGRFTDEALCHFHPFRPPLIGARTIEDYWKQATSSRGEVSVQMGKPWLDGDRRHKLREYWSVVADEGLEPPPGWGQ